MRRPVLAAVLCAASQFLLTALILLAGKHLAPPEAFARVKLLAFASTLLLPLVLAQVLGLWRSLGLERVRPGAFFFATLLPAALFVSTGVRGHGTLVSDLVIQLLNAFGEELLFRGVVFALLVALPRGRSIVLNGVLFGSMHLLHGFMDGNWVAALQWAGLTSISGMMFTAVRYETRSLWLCVVLHFVVNLCKMYSNLEAVAGHGVFVLAQRCAYALELGLAGIAIARGWHGSRELREPCPEPHLRSA